MKKVERQRIIKQLITENEIETQDELITRLQEKGIQATQATVSRDIREMSIVKAHDANGKVKYAIFSQKPASSSEEKLKEAVKDSVSSVERIQFMSIIHTDLGRADVVANFLDEVAYEEVAGTVAGVDTLIVISRSEVEASDFVKRIEEMIE